VGPTSLWAKRSIWKLSFARSPTGTNRRVHDFGSLEWLVSFESDVSLFAGSTVKAVETLFHLGPISVRWVDREMSAQLL
jgi:hypothetical protein